MQIRLKQTDHIKLHLPGNRKEPSEYTQSIQSA